ncbi:hypothetical protein EIN_086640 [Entamoeba invadens IP1]|uniref:hypothetical protein n=1 Tax=Entamoeba invadens IP1 TaxID=370355 RepID=UPI0002C3F8B9|nr:hypothetical protein EIN_086640 [Entamoeba invadens IP1]ELP85382.1 hypothetical protein EIN_086640 [Entamoeba invadens IP1]|eukprot:XP_004184728.1 hypothetical protein EIN_086640 [Entamoeba invadens IP1]
MEVPPQAYNYMKEAIESSDIVMVRELCREFGVPSALRMDIWKMFLQPKREFVEERNTQVNYVPEWLQLTEGQKIEATQIALTIHPVGTQPFLNGVIDIAAVVSKLYPEESKEFRCGITKALLYKFHPFFKYLYPTIVTGLQNLIHMLLLYHDPILSIHLDTYRIEPTDYTNSFGFNLCSGMCEEFDTLVHLWDEFITFPDTTLYIYCIVGYLIFIREDFLAVKNTEKGTNFVRKILGKKLKDDDIKTVVAVSKAIRLSTASSFNRILLGVMNNSDAYQQIFSKSLNSSLFLPTLTNDVINDKMNRQMPFLFIDCRRQESFEVGSILAAINLDFLKRQDDRKYLDDLFKNELSLLTQKDSAFHVVLFGDDDSEDGVPDIGELSMIGLDFAKRGVKRVSIMSQGFVTFHKNAMNSIRGFQLMNHENTICPLCTTGKPLKFTEVVKNSNLISETTITAAQTIAHKTVEKTKELSNGLMGFLYGTAEKKEKENKESKESKEEIKEPPKENQIPQKEEKVIEQKPQEIVPTKPEDTPVVNEDGKTPDEEKEEEKEDEEDDAYLKEIISESSRYDSYLNVGGKQTIWKPIVTVVTTISLLLVEMHGEKIVLLDDISFESITKVVMKKSEPDRFTIVHTGGKCTIRVPENYAKFVEEISSMQQ